MVTSMKKLVAIILSLVQCLVAFGIRALATNDYDVYVDSSKGSTVYTEIAPFIHNGRTFLPVCYFADAFRIYMTWDDTTKTATLERLTTVMRFTVDSDIITLTKNNITSSIKMDVAPMIISNIVCVPIRYVAEAFDLLVKWREFDESWIIQGCSSEELSGKNNLYGVTVQETVQEYGSTVFNAVIGIKAISADSGGFFSFYESNHFRFAYWRFFHFMVGCEYGIPIFQPYIGSIDISLDGNNIIISEPFRYGRAGCFTAVCENAAGTSYADMNLESVINHIAAQYETEVDYKYTTFNGFRSVSYALIPPIDREVRIVSGIALFNNDLLMRFEYTEIFSEGSNYRVNKEAATSHLKEFLTSLVIK